jgi:transcriptional regulator with XRE-family HTH domain
MARGKLSGKSRRKRKSAAGAFAVNVRAILQRRGISQAQLARAVDMNKSTLNHWLTGTALPSALGAAQIATFLDVSLDELYGGDPPAAKHRR